MTTPRRRIIRPHQTALEMLHVKTEQSMHSGVRAPRTAAFDDSLRSARERIARQMAHTPRQIDLGRTV